MTSNKYNQFNKPAKTCKLTKRKKITNFFIVGDVPIGDEHI